jgi:hypothetical protein
MNAQVKVPKSLAKRGEDANLMGLRCVHQDFLGDSLLTLGTNSTLIGISRPHHPCVGPFRS